MIKILLVSNIPGESDRIIASLNVSNATIISKETDYDEKATAKYAHDIFAAGNFDMMVLVVKKPTALDVAFKKYDDVIAAVCRDTSDAKDARDSDVNALIIKEQDIEAIDSIISAFAGSGISSALKQIKMPSMPKRAEAPAPAQQQRRPEPQQQPQPQIQQRKPLQILPKPKPKPQPEPDDEPNMPKRPGLQGWIKDSLGIVDTEKPQKPADKSKKDKKREDQDGK